MTGPERAKIMHVTMLEPLFDRFVAWAESQHFDVAQIPGTDPDQWIVVPDGFLMAAVAEVREEPRE